MTGFSPVGSTPVGAVGGDDGNFYPQAGGIVFRGSNVTANQAFPAPGKLTFLGALPAAVLAAPRVTWMGVEALHAGSPNERVSWLGVEVLRSTAFIPTITQVTWLGAEVQHDGASATTDRVTWIGSEVQHDGHASDRVTWVGVEVLRTVKDRSPDSGWVCLIAA